MKTTRRSRGGVKKTADENITDVETKAKTLKNKTANVVTPEAEDKTEDQPKVDEQKEETPEGENKE